jgi:hypothetical protein
MIKTQQPVTRTPVKEEMSPSTMLPGSGVLPDDFAHRLHRLKEASGLSWNRFAEKLGVDPRQVSRWRKGVEPCGGAMLSLLRLALLMPGGLEMLLGFRSSGNPRESPVKPMIR